MVLDLLADVILPHRQRHVWCALKHSQMCYLSRGTSFSVLLTDMDLDVTYLWSDLLDYLHAARAGTDDPDSLSGSIDAFFGPAARVAARSFKRVTSFHVGYERFGRVALDDPVIN